MQRAKKSLGQNFLVDPNIQQKIVDALAPAPDRDVLEIGPGTGALTRRLAGRVRTLAAIELDDRLAAALQDEFTGRDDVRILHGDALALDVRTITKEFERLTVVGNIPYNITSPLLFRVLERAHRPRRLVVMVQKEVADRIVAAPGDKQYGALSVGVRTVAEAVRLFVVPRGAFRPAPNVDSAVLRIDPVAPPPLTPSEESDVRTLTRAAFGWRRKQLQRILRDAPEYTLDSNAVATLEQAMGIPFTVRPEELTPGDFVRLARGLRALTAPDQGA